MFIRRTCLTGCCHLPCNLLSSFLFFTPKLSHQKERVFVQVRGRPSSCAKAGHLKHMAFPSHCDTDWNRAGRLIKRTLAFRRGHQHNREGNVTSVSINPEGLERATGWKTEWWKPGYNHCYFTLQLLKNVPSYPLMQVIPVCMKEDVLDFEMRLKWKAWGFKECLVCGWTVLNMNSTLCQCLICLCLYWTFFSHAFQFLHFFLYPSSFCLRSCFLFSSFTFNIIIIFFSSSPSPTGFAQ